MHQRDLADVAEAQCQTGTVPRRRQRGQKQSGKDRNDRDHDQKFDQGEPAHDGTVPRKNTGMLFHFSSLRDGHKCRK